MGWICALPLELAAAQGMLEEEYDNKKIQKNPRDTNTYCLGRIGDANVVLTCLVSAGNNQAGSAAIHMRETFQNLSFILMVGIGGGVPNPDTGKDVRLGDIVVSMPSGLFGGVIKYDAGKFLQNQDFEIIGVLPPPPPLLQKVVKFLVARYESEENCIIKHIEEMLRKRPKYSKPGTDYRRPNIESDILFRTEYVHEGGGENCEKCDPKQLVARPGRSGNEPALHYGIIASGSAVVRDALKRDQLGQHFNALCVEMEAAGLMDENPCLVIRGICDYSDSHKNKDWQRYAAATAAAYAKELLNEISQPNLEGLS